MENATKALLMGAAILIAIIILSLAIVVYSRVSEYYQQKQRNITEEQLAAFNNEYAVYDRDDVSGFELVSLINKAIDFNQNMVYGQNNRGTDEADYNTTLGEGYSEMSISVTIPDNLSSSYSEKLFGKGTIKYDNKNNNINKRGGLVNKIREMQTLEKNVPQSDLNALQQKAYEFKGLSDLATKDKIKEITNRNYKITNEDIFKYSDYVTFKRGTFDCTNMDYDKYGQIQIFEFKQIK